MNLAFGNANAVCYKWRIKHKHVIITVAAITAKKMNLQHKHKHVIITVIINVTSSATNSRLLLLQHQHKHVIITVIIAT